MAKLILLRHGQSTWNLENRFTGWVDVPLTPQGEEEARLAGEKLKDIHLDIAYTSVLKRAIETLTIALEAASQPGVPTLYDAALNERMYGDLQGLNKAETAEKFGAEQVRLWRRSYDVAPPGGESLKDTAARTLPYFHGTIMASLREGKNTIISAHGNSLRAIGMALDNLDEEGVLKLEIGNGVPIVYDIDLSGKVLNKTIL
ncbi:MAG: 2,3-bisphosphoglycerate-dependent phosphoglycerate mutase [Armatimonadota bacterium]|nr:2,3-bisphosphoglycerate-dependent phosphoglycerate mutase [Armatimonadota bacterium]